MAHTVTGTVVRIIVRRRHQILLVQNRRLHAANEFELPGGKVKKNESYLDAAKRELAEETGLELRAAKQLQLYDRETPFRTFWRYVIFEAEEYGGEIIVNDTDEILIADWFGKSQNLRLDEHTQFFCRTYAPNKSLWLS